MVDVGKYISAKDPGLFEDPQIPPVAPNKNTLNDKNL